MGLFSSLLSKNLSEQNSNISSYWNDKIFLEKQSLYYKNLEKIENQWSVLYNLKAYDGELASKYINLCKRNIAQFKDMNTHGMHFNDYQTPIVVPAYKRLSMIYEKQGKYEDSAKICIDAIMNGITQDGSKAGMKGRAARMFKKAKITPDDSTMNLLLD